MLQRQFVKLLFEIYNESPIICTCLDQPATPSILTKENDVKTSTILYYFTSPLPIHYTTTTQIKHTTHAIITYNN